MAQAAPGLQGPTGTRDQKNIEHSGTVGGLAGGFAGAAAGATVGSIVPVIGTAIGGVIGGVLGALGGSEVGKKIGGFFFGDEAAAQKGQPSPQETAAQTAQLLQQQPIILGEFYYFRHPSLRTGFAPCQGGILANAVTQHPEIWAYLQTAEGQLLLKTEAEWQAMSTATWATLADGTKVGWNGIGGVPYYVQDLATGMRP